jgi:nucleotide-binding universal stress UspA family protein
MKKTAPNVVEAAPFHRVLIGTDFSEGAEWAIERAERLAIASGGELIIAHVQPDDVPPKYRQVVRRQAEDLLEKTVRRVSRSFARFKKNGIKVAPVLRAGLPSVEIMRLARTLMAETIVVGKHGRRRIRDLVIGSTAEKITRQAGLPVLVVNQPPSADSYVRPAIALDLDDAFLPIIATTLRVIGPSECPIVGIHAYDTPFEGFVPYREIDAYRRQCRAEALSNLRERLESLEENFRWKLTVQLGDPRAVLVREIIKRRVDLIALGTHGHSRLSHALFGSVVDYVLRSVQCDVLVSPSTQSFLASA